MAVARAQFLLLCLGFSCVDATRGTSHNSQLVDATTLLQSVTSMERSTLPSLFFDEGASLSNKGSQRTSAQATKEELPSMALFDVGTNSVAMPTRWQVHGGTSTGARTALSLAQAPAPRDRQVFSGISTNEEQQSAMLQDAFNLADEGDKKVAMDEASQSPLPPWKTEPPLVQGAPETSLLSSNEEPAAEAPQESESWNLLQESTEQQSKQSDDVEDPGTAVAFVECQAAGGDDCMNLGKKQSASALTETPVAVERPQLKKMQPVDTDKRPIVDGAKFENAVQEDAQRSQRIQSQQEILTRELDAIKLKYQNDIVLQMPANSPKHVDNALLTEATDTAVESIRQRRSPPAASSADSFFPRQRRPSLLANARAQQARFAAPAAKTAAALESTSEELSLEEISRRLAEDEQRILAAVQENDAEAYHHSASMLDARYPSDDNFPGVDGHILPAARGYTQQALN